MKSTHGGDRAIINTPRAQLLQRDFTELKHVIDAAFDAAAPFYAQHDVFVYGKTHPTPRKSTFVSDAVEGYRFSGKMVPSRAMQPADSMFIRTVNGLVGESYNSILYNRYADGKDKIGSHSDDERDIVPGSDVCIVSRGTPRTFRVRDSKTRAIVVDVLTLPYHGLIMSGDFQTMFKHEIVQDAKVSTPRESASFRTFRAVPTEPPAKRTRH